MEQRQAQAHQAWWYAHLWQQQRSFLLATGLLQCICSPDLVRRTPPTPCTWTAA